jgi:chromatin segregation and condensation protein Rec8/ScpA/Scc1 (kleisin family)
LIKGKKIEAEQPEPFGEVWIALASPVVEPAPAALS